MGDGTIAPCHNQKSGRAGCTLQHEEFCRYFMSKFEKYNPTIIKCFSKRSTNQEIWNGFTKFHPDLYQQYLRWYSKISDEPLKYFKTTKLFLKNN